MAELWGTRLGRRMRWLDPIGDVVQPWIRKAVDSVRPLRNGLDGTWFGAPLHPAVTDLPVGATTVAVLLDSVDGATGSRRFDSAADAALAVGVAGYLPAALTGVADWRNLQGEIRRTGSVHALLNVVGLVLNAASLVLRSTGRRRAGRIAAGVGYLASTVAAAHVGGELSYGLGARMNKTPAASGPEDFTTVLSASDVADGDMRRVDVDGNSVLITRTLAGTPCAIAAVCSHEGGPLEEGERQQDSVVCPLHGSRFDLNTGEVLDGPAVFALPRWEAREHAGNIEIRQVRKEREA